MPKLLWVAMTLALVVVGCSSDGSDTASTASTAVTIVTAVSVDVGPILRSHGSKRVASAR